RGFAAYDGKPLPLRAVQAVQRRHRHQIHRAARPRDTAVRAPCRAAASFRQEKMNRILYLHGFASGPSSSKAQFFKRRLEAEGATVEIPALDGGDFENLTITGQLEIIQKTADGGPVSLMGSSMGGYLAAIYAWIHPEVAKLVLLAPAFGFARRWEIA